ncbi:MAG: TlpA disulfide reductase family protein [Acidobacteriota bacterium]
MKALLILILPLLILSCRPAAAPVSVSTRPIRPGEKVDTNLPMPPKRPVSEMVWTSMEGTTANMGQLRGKAIILDFWATYCPPCRDEIPHLNELQAKYGIDNLQIIGLNVGGDEDKPKIPAFAKEYKVSYPIAFPEDDLLQFVTGNDDRIPQTAVFDRSGKLITKIVGFDNSAKKALDTAVESALGTN